MNRDDMAARGLAEGDPSTSSRPQGRVHPARRRLAGARVACRASRQRRRLHAGFNVPIGIADWSTQSRQPLMKQVVVRIVASPPGTPPPRSRAETRRAGTRHTARLCPRTGWNCRGLDGTATADWMELPRTGWNYRGLDGTAADGMELPWTGWNCRGRVGLPHVEAVVVRPSPRRRRSRGRTSPTRHRWHRPRRPPATWSWRRRRGRPGSRSTTARWPRARELVTRVVRLRPRRAEVEEVDEPVRAQRPDPVGEHPAVEPPLLTPRRAGRRRTDGRRVR